MTVFEVSPSIKSLGKSIIFLHAGCPRWRRACDDAARRSDDARAGKFWIRTDRLLLYMPGVAARPVLYPLESYADTDHYIRLLAIDRIKKNGRASIKTSFKRKDLCTGRVDYEAVLCVRWLRTHVGHKARAESITRLCVVS